jgi:hypothetical protein
MPTSLVATIKSLVGRVQNHAIAIGNAETTAFLRGEKLLLDLSGERMKALRVRLSNQVGQLEGTRFTQFFGRCRTFLQTSSLCHGRCSKPTVEGWPVSMIRPIGPSMMIVIRGAPRGFLI